MMPRRRRPCCKGESESLVAGQSKIFAQTLVILGKNQKKQ